MQMQITPEILVLFGILVVTGLLFWLLHGFQKRFEATYQMSIGDLPKFTEQGFQPVRREEHDKILSSSQTNYDSLQLIEQMEKDIEETSLLVEEHINQLNVHMDAYNTIHTRMNHVNNKITRAFEQIDTLTDAIIELQMDIEVVE